MGTGKTFYVVVSVSTWVELGGSVRLTGWDGGAEGRVGFDAGRWNICGRRERLSVGGWSKREGEQCHSRGDRSRWCIWISGSSEVPVMMMLLLLLSMSMRRSVGMVVLAISLGEDGNGCKC